MRAPVLSRPRRPASGATAVEAPAADEGRPAGRELVLVAAGLAALVAVSAFMRLHWVHSWFWIDEGLSVGIARHPVTEIPRLLRQDGSPPLFYLVLHFWMRAVGSSETQTHLLPVLFALATIPAALWAGWSLFGRRVGWFCAALAAFNPYLTAFSDETRMYTLVALFSLLATATFLHAFVFRRRQYLPAFAVLLSLLMYTHSWGLFYAVAAAAAFVLCLVLSNDRRRLVLDGLLAFGGAGALFLPWLPTVLYQARHTGAPWALPPSSKQAVREVSAILGGDRTITALVLTGWVSLGFMLQRPKYRYTTALFSATIIFFGTITTAWLISQSHPAWIHRYLAMALGAGIIAMAYVLGRAGSLGALALALTIIYSVHPLTWLRGGPDAALGYKSNVRQVSATVKPEMERGDLVVTIQPEQVAVLRYYLGPGLRWADPRGTVLDPGLMDWRDALDQLRGANVERDLAPLVDALPVGKHVAFVAPTRAVRPRDAPWFHAIKDREHEWKAALQQDPRLRAVPVPPTRRGDPLGVSVYALLFEKVGP